jgi:hypothetical protein
VTSVGIVRRGGARSHRAPNAREIVARVFGCFPPPGAESVSPFPAVRTRLESARRDSNADGDGCSHRARGLDGYKGLGEAQEDMLVKALVAQTAIDRFNCILHRQQRRRLR